MCFKGTTATLLRSACLVKMKGWVREALIKKAAKRFSGGATEVRKSQLFAISNLKRSQVRSLPQAM